MAEQNGFNRRYFRLVLGDHPATMQVTQIGDRPGNTDPKTVYLADIGGGGMKIVCNDDLPIRRGVVASFRFDLAGHIFSLQGTLVRKLDALTRFEYGVAFTDLDDRQQSLLISILWRLQIEQRRNRGDAPRPENVVLPLN